MELSHTKNALSETSELLHVGINLGWSTSGYLPQVVAFCKQKNPRLRISYMCLDFQSLTSSLREKRLDAVIALENDMSHSLEFETERFTSLQRSILYSNNLPDYEQIRNPADFYPYDFLIADDPLIRHLV